MNTFMANFGVSRVQFRIKLANDGVHDFAGSFQPPTPVSPTVAPPSKKSIPFPSDKKSNTTIVTSPMKLLLWSDDVRVLKTIF